MIKFKVKGRGSRSLARIAVLENEYGVRVETPAYAVRAEQLEEYIVTGRAAELGALVELDVGSPSAVHGVARYARLASGNGVPYYFTLKPTMAEKATHDQVVEILGKLAETVDLHPEGYIATVMPVGLLSTYKQAVQQYCRKHTCIAMISLSALTKTALAKQVNVYRQLAGENLVEATAIAVSNMKASLLSERRAKLLGELLLQTGGRDKLVLSYGSLSVKPLKTKPGVGLAADLAQYHLQVDIAGPTRAPRGAPQAEPRRRLLIPAALLYLDLQAAKPEDTEHVVQLLQKLGSKLPKRVRQISIDEIVRLPIAELEIVNLEERLGYLENLRETANPDTMLDETLKTLETLGLHEAVETMTKAIAKVERKLAQNKLEQHL